MNTLLWMIDGDKIPGGHRVQIDKTAEGLRELGCHAEISFAEEIELDGIDVVHGFGLPPQTMRELRQAGVPIVLSTIYWSRRYILGLDRKPRTLNSWLRRTRMACSLGASVLGGQYPEKIDRLSARWQTQRQQYELADLLLPNSEAEGQQIVDDLGVTTPMHVAPNAVDPAHFTLGEGKGQGFLYVGRIEPHKNQLGLVRAMRGSALPLTLIGEEHPHHRDYADKVRRSLSPNQKLLPGIPHDDLAGVYQRHRVHALPSWFETTGLVSLEAALCGLNVVTTQCGYARSYLADYAWYCDPEDPRSIREAVEAAHAAPIEAGLRDRVLNHYTWRHTAEATLAAYRQVVSTRGENVFA